jgi:alpha-N-arabinofuranosidase
MIAMLLTCLAIGAAHAQEPQPIPNPGFEERAEEGPVGWSARDWSEGAIFAHVDEGREGGWCVRIDADQGADASWSTTIAVRPFAEYRLSGWIRTEDVTTLEGGSGALFNIHEIRTAHTEPLTGTHDWTRVETTFSTGSHDLLLLNCLFGGWGLATGTAWYDDLELELVRVMPVDFSATVRVDEVGHPVSELIYGQFIEHLGRCIYGGIWAEMVEDRKFYYPPGTEESPWTVIGDDDALTMATDDPFVGDHDPVLTVSGDPVGLTQLLPGIESGESYEGRIILSASEGIESVVVRLNWRSRRDGQQSVVLGDLAEEMTEYPLTFDVGLSRHEPILEIVATGEGTVRVGTVSLMPSDNIHGMRADTLALLKELDSPIYRWPGGNFVSGYDWRDGIGDRDRRPPRKNPAWTGVEHNDFGIDEFMVFCRELGTEPYIVVNSGLGGVESAVDELLYANAPAETPMGMERAANGHPEPYDVTWWGIGNEMYGGWQLGHMPVEEYVQKHNEFARAMWAADPDIKLIGVGAAGPWSEAMLTHCAEYMDSISEHFYRQEGSGLLGHVSQMAEAVGIIAGWHRQYQAEQGGEFIPIALDEWNYWYGEHVYGELGTRYFLKDALGVGAALNEFIRQSDVYLMGNYAQTVNVIGAIKTTPTDAAFATTGLVLKLYRQRMGELPVAVEMGESPLDVVATWNEDRTALTLAVVNATTEPQTLDLTVLGAELTGEGTAWVIAGDDPMLYNQPGLPPPVYIHERALGDLGDSLPLDPISVTVFELPIVQ